MSASKDVNENLGVAAAETCRRACGGNGFLLASGLPRIFGLNVAACTYEGENTILDLQTARYLSKSIRLANNDHSSSPPSNVQDASSSIGYLYRVIRPDIGRLDKREGKIVTDIDGLFRLLSASAYYHCHFAFDQVECKMQVQTDLHDMVLMSDFATKAPLNQIDPNPAYIKYIKELTKSKL